MVRKERPTIPYQQGAKPRQTDTNPSPTQTETTPVYQQGAQPSA